MKIVILGGTGLVGTHLKTQLSKIHDVQVFGRDAFQSKTHLTHILQGSDIIIQLAGANIGQRWNDEYKQTLWSSRIDTTRLLASAVAELPQAPKQILCASAIGFYPENDCTHPLDENHTEAGPHFLAQLSQAWEAEARKMETFAPLTIMRFGVVLAEQGGALQKMLLPFKLGLGGPVAGGQQCFSWISLHDLGRAIEFVIQRELTGILNLTAPNPLTQKAFAQTLAQVLHRPCVIPLPLWQLKLMFGEGAQVLTLSSAILPTRLLGAGFEFQHTDALGALTAILNKKSA